MIIGLDSFSKQILNIMVYFVLYQSPVWPNFFLMNVFFALKGSEIFIIIPSTATNPSLEQIKQC